MAERPDDRHPLRDRAKRGALTALLILATIASGCGATASPGRVSGVAARAELRGLIEDVTAATAYRYRTTDDAGRSMDTAKIIWIPEANAFAAVYHTWSDTDSAFHVQIATSVDLMGWTWRQELASLASQPTIAAASDGGYVVAWEQEPDPIHLAIAYYATWVDLQAGKPTRRIDPPVTTPACGEGTPSIEAASSAHVDLAFHYHADCDLDRQAGGSTDWTTWRANTRPGIDKALADVGVRGHMGDRDHIAFRGNDFTLIEGQLARDDVSSWRTFLYDEWAGSVEPLRFRTHAGSMAFSNPTITQIEIDGAAAILVTLYVITEGAAGSEGGELIYYRLIPHAGATSAVGPPGPYQRSSQ